VTSWTEKSPTCGLFDFVTLCGNRPFDFLHCENRGAARGE